MTASKINLVVAFLLMSNQINGQQQPKVVAPPNMNREIDLVSYGHRNTVLHETLSRDVAQMMVTKNVSILVEFSQNEHNRGTLISVYGGSSKVFELYSEGLKGELRAYWRREYSLANLNIQNIELDDEEWHKIIFDLHGDQMRLTIDCLDTGVSGEYPEIDFSLLNRTKPSVYVTQRFGSQSMLMGKMRQFKVRQNSYYNEFCVGPVLRNFATPLLGINPGMTTTNTTSQQQPDTIDDLRNKVKSLENEVSKWRPQSIQPSVRVPISSSGKVSNNNNNEPDPSKGVCPDCYEYLRFKINYLEEEFKRWRDSVQKVENNLKRVMLFQRGCMINDTYYNDGESWTTNCTECVCNLGKPMCKPVGCKLLNCTKPLRKEGQCCPVCGASCYYMQKNYDHGRVFWPKTCVRCECKNGDTSCAYHSTECPTLNCTTDQHFTPENQCCPICLNENFCSSNPCHSNATCTNLAHGPECNCKEGFFGDGTHHCFDIDECKVDDNDKRGKPCSSGSRCINTFGGYHCECLPGFVKINNRTCFDSIAS